MISLESAPIAEPFLSRIAERVLQSEKNGTTPHLAIVLVGEDDQSLRYIEIKTKTAKKLGIITSLYHIESGSSYDEVEKTLQFLAIDEEMNG